MRSSIGLCLALVACGSKSGLMLPSGGSGGTGGGSPGGTPAPACFSPGVRVPARPIGSACAFEGGNTIAIAVNSGKRVYAIDVNGALSTLFTFGVGAPADTSSALAEVVASRGGYIAAGIALVPLGQANPIEATLETVLIDPSGAVVFHEQRSVPYKNFADVHVFGNADGVFAFGFESYEASEVTVVAPDGTELGRFPKILPIGDPDAAGRLAVRRNDERLWLDACSGRLTPVRAESLPFYTAIAAIGSELLYVDALEPAAVIETFGGADRRPLSIPPTAAQRLTHPSRWALYGTDSAPWRYDLANVALGAVRAIDVELPAGLRRFFDGAPGFDTSSTNEAALDSSGRVLAGLRDDALGRLYATQDGKSWEPIGLPVGEVHRLASIERNGSYLISGASLGRLPSDWAPPPAGSGRIDYQQVQLARPENGFAIVLIQASPGTGFTRAFELSADGGCAGTLLGDGTLSVTSALTGASRSFTFPVASPFYGDFSFVPGENAWLAPQ